MQKYGPNSNPEAFLHFIKVADVFQTTGTIVETGIVDIKHVYNHSGTSIIRAWEKMKPIIMGMRQQANSPDVYPQFETLYNMIIKYRSIQIIN